MIIPNLALAADQVLEHARDGGRGASSASSCVATCALVSAAAHPQQLLLELRQFRRLLCRPGVVDELHAEHHALAQQARTQCSSQSSPAVLPLSAVCVTVARLVCDIHATPAAACCSIVQ